jgi:integrase/recombinase XerD
MSKTITNQWSITKFEQETNLLIWMEAFLIDRKAQGMAPGTLYFYKQKLKLFQEYCQAQIITEIPQITPVLIRQYMLYLEETKHNEGGRHACFRAIKTFLRWYEQEVEPQGWTNPIKKVKAPKLSVEPLEPIETDHLRAMIATCEKNTFHGDRDKAILLALLDTGTRASEFVAMDLVDMDRTTRSILIRKGKGRKPRNVYLGATSRKAVRAYLKHRRDDSTAIWVTESGERLTYWGLRQIIRRRAEKAEIPEPGIHSFRRAFALNCLRNGMDIYSLQKLMGHSDLQVLRRYLKQTDEDADEAHRKGSPVDSIV